MFGHFCFARIGKTLHWIEHTQAPCTENSGSLNKHVVGLLALKRDKHIDVGDKRGVVTRRLRSARCSRAFSGCNCRHGFVTKLVSTSKPRQR